jgi:hypothetical protein
MHAACLDFAEEICNMEGGSVKRVAFVTMVCSEKTYSFSCLHHAQETWLATGVLCDLLPVLYLLCIMSFM